MIGSDEPALAAGEEGEGEVEGEEGVRIRLVPILLLLPRGILPVLGILLTDLVLNCTSVFTSPLSIFSSNVLTNSMNCSNPLNKSLMTSLSKMNLQKYCCG
jgi:hypothetical protein